MGWFWADPQAGDGKKNSGASCPVKPKAVGSPAAAEAVTMPVDLMAGGLAPPPECPMHNKFPPSANSADALNPLNLMPTLSQAPAPSQKIALPTERTISSIPKGADPNSKEKWEYPSPQQMYNAMIRKGGPAPEDAVESMVAVHNFLNEGAWAEIIEWEKVWAKGVGQGLSRVFSDEFGTEEEKVRLERRNESAQTDDEEDADESTGARLLRFEGKSQQRTPKSLILENLSKLFPSTFSSEIPFDRHDWFVLRRNGETVRYVIDYYGGGAEGEEGMPTFYLDVRPAIDRPSAVLERVGMWGGEVWRKASGASVRLEKKREEELKRREEMERETGSTFKKL